MNRKIIIIIIVIAIIIGITTIALKNKNRNTQSASNTQAITNIEEELKKTIAKSKESYINYGRENFDVYFGVNFINENFISGEISLVTNLENNPIDSNVKIYLKNGENIEQFPTINYEKENYKIEAGKVYLLKVYSYMNSINYYYTMQLDKSGNSNLQLVCYVNGDGDY